MATLFTLLFKQHVKTLCKKASTKLHALAQISCYVETENLQHLMRAFIPYPTLAIVRLFECSTIEAQIKE